MAAENGRGKRVAVVGGGVAGLAAAEEIVARGHRAEIFEADSVVGGRVAPAPLGERGICLGGKNVGRRYLRLRELLARRGYGDYELFGPSAAQVVGGRARPLSLRSPAMRARIGASVLAHGQVRGGMRFLRLVEHVRAAHGNVQLGDRFFDDLAARAGDPALPDYLGSALCRAAIRHMTVRMNAAEPDECHLGNVGSNLALAVDRFDQLTGDGLAGWLQAVGAAHPTHRESRVAELRPAAGRVGGLVTARGREHDGFDGVVLAVPAHEAARVIGALEPALARLLCTIRYFPVAVVVAEYDRSVFPERFAALSAPAGLALSNAGSYGLGERHLVRYTFSGRAARDRVEPDRFDPEALLNGAERFLARHVPVGQARRARFAARAFRPGLCAYRRDHGLFRREVAATLEGLPGLALAGDYIRGASLEACVRSGQEAAERALADRPGGIEDRWTTKAAGPRLHAAAT